MPSISKAMWTSNRRIYLNAEGQPVEANDPARASLLVAEGGSIPQEQAVSLGLIEVEPAKVKALKPTEAEDKAVKPAENKAAKK